MADTHDVIEIDARRLNLLSNVVQMALESVGSKTPTRADSVCLMVIAVSAAKQSGLGPLEIGDLMTQFVMVGMTETERSAMAKDALATADQSLIRSLLDPT